MSPRIDDRTAPRRELPRVGPFRGFWLVTALAIVICLVGANRLLVSPSFVKRITVVNPTPFAVDLDVTGADRKAWLQLGAAPQHATTVFEEVLDQGSTWIVRLADGDGGELRFTRDELVRAGWHVEIPTVVEGRLRPTWGPPERLAR